MFLSGSCNGDGHMSRIAGMFGRFERRSASDPVIISVQNAELGPSAWPYRRNPEA